MSCPLVWRPSSFGCIARLTWGSYVPRSTSTSSFQWTHILVNDVPLLVSGLLSDCTRCAGIGDAFLALRADSKSHWTALEAKRTSSNVVCARVLAKTRDLDLARFSAQPWRRSVEGGRGGGGVRDPLCAACTQAGKRAGRLPALDVPQQQMR